MAQCPECESTTAITSEEFGNLNTGKILGAAAGTAGGLAGGVSAYVPIMTAALIIGAGPIAMTAAFLGMAAGGGFLGSKVGKTIAKSVGNNGTKYYCQNCKNIWTEPVA